MEIRMGKQEWENLNGKIGLGKREWENEKENR